MTGPDVVKTVTNEVVTQEALGGAITHTTKTIGGGQCIRRTISRRCSPRATSSISCRLSNRESVPERPTDGSEWDRVEPSLDTLIPASANQPYDMHELIRKTVDEGDFFETQPAHAGNVITGFGRIEGRTDRRRREPADGTRGRARHQFERRKRRASCASVTRSTFPLLTFVDVPGFLPGTAQEHNGIIKHGAKAAVRLCRGDRAQNHRHHPQGLWRRV